ncbi:DUF3043 domain-containing protein [Microbacterium sp. YY-01]|uniref:DUF3043 domain-containing protein n=1 Tax=Microbacterium sp. YY-01 TaxID=3421634 RepID=UPI003D18046A
MANTDPSSSSSDDTTTERVGKGRPTPTRAEREAARRRPLVDNSKEARARARAELREKRERARIGMANGEERFLPERDRGPQRRWVRDYVDAGWHVQEWIMAMMIVVIVASIIPVMEVAYWSFVVLWAYVLVAILSMILLGIRVKRKAAIRFGADKREKGLGWYAAMRSMQMRFMRTPNAQVKRGQYPDLQA